MGDARVRHLLRVPQRGRSSYGVGCRRNLQAAHTLRSCTPAPLRRAVLHTAARSHVYLHAHAPNTHVPTPTPTPMRPPPAPQANYREWQKQEAERERLQHAISEKLKQERIVQLQEKQARRQRVSCV